MTIDREVRSEKVAQRVKSATGALIEPPAAAVPGPSASEPVSRITVLAYFALGLLLVIWFLVDWLVLGKGFVDSFSESLGTGFALLLLVAVVSTVRGSRRG